MCLLCSESKGADQLRGNRAADLRLYFRISKKSRLFPDAVSGCATYKVFMVILFYIFFILQIFLKVKFCINIATCDLLYDVRLFSPQHSEIFSENMGHTWKTTNCGFQDITHM